MIALAALAVLLLVATVWFLARPLARVQAAGGNEEYHQLAQVRARLLAQLNELDIESGDGRMDATVAGDERLRIEAELARVLRRLETLTPVSAARAGASAARRLRIVVLVAFAILLPAAAIGLYAVKQGTALSQLALLGPDGQPDPLKMVARLEKRLAGQPDDLAGWAQLGRSYLALERYAEAKQAYARAASLAPEDIEILTEYASLVLVSEDPRRPSREAVELFTRLYKIDPKHPSALWVLGLDAYNAGRYRQAAQYWEGLLKALPPGSEVEPRVRQALAQARARAKR